MTPIRILVVDDFEPWRHIVVSMIAKEAEWFAVGEASDGPEAIQKAKELKPDLVLLDISLPKLNGIDAARQIRHIAPKSKIIFISQESCADVVQEALSIGAGFVIKTSTAKDLLSAVNSVIQDRQFLSSRSDFTCDHTELVQPLLQGST